MKKEKEKTKERRSFEDKVINWQNVKDKYDETTKKFNTIKDLFYKAAEDEFKKQNYPENIVVEDKKFLVNETEEASENAGIRVTRVVRSTITFDLRKLKKKLSREVYNNVVEKKYVVKDVDAVVDFLKKTDISTEQFNKLIKVEETLNQSKLDNLGDVGIITDEHLKETYKVSEGKPYFKTTKLKGS